MMNGQIRLNGYRRRNRNSAIVVETAFQSFLADKTALGAVSATITTYKAHMSAMSEWIKPSTPVEAINQDFANRIIIGMLDKGLAKKSVQSYMISLRAFINYCRDRGWTDEKIRGYRAPEVVKDTYTEDELIALLAKPDMATCSFEDYRTWVIINLLVNNGCRCGTVCAIQNRDVGEIAIVSRHNKNQHVQSLPLSSRMKAILKEYMQVRQGEPEDALFCDRDGRPMTVNALRLAIKRYNKSRGVTKTSVHMFRHTFAKQFLLECDGDAFTLQKLLGHATLDMTRHYCNIYDAEIARNYDSHSPLSRLTEPR